MHSIVKSSYDELIDRKVGRVSSKDLGLKSPAGDVDIIIVIPCFAEEEVIKTLRSIDLSRKDDLKIEVILLINESEDVVAKHHLINEECFRTIKDYIHKHIHDWHIQVVYVTDIPRKIAGVGTARKLAMDAAALRFQEIGKLENGIIVNLDADCLVSQNYIQAIHVHFKTNFRDELVSIAFQHRIDELEDSQQRKAIQQYEDYLHYFIQMQKDLGLPYAFQTIGSAFAVRANAYLQVGGMNRRKAGEDFYFIHKFTKKGTIATLDECIVYPSGRESFRVPFGTGKAVADMMKSAPIYYAYHPQSFYNLTKLVDGVESLFTEDLETFIAHLPKGIREYLLTQNFLTAIEKLRNNTSSISSFTKAFYQWFDAFRLMKYLHFVRDRYYPSIPIDEIEKRVWSS